MDVNRAQIVKLRDAPEFSDQVVKQNNDEWRDLLELEPTEMAALFSTNHLPNTLPVTLIALLNGHYIGCGSLREGPLGKRKYPSAYHPDTPWVSDIWVHPSARGQKLATRIVSAIEEEARRCGFDKLYISTVAENALYDRMGYQEVSRSVLNGTPLRSLRRSL